MKKKIDFMLTAFRDGFQSVYGARVFSKDFLPIVQEAVHAGISHIEAGGGALFQSAFFYCNENAFDVMDKFRVAAGPAANLQTLARGINVIALDSQPSDIIKLHAELFKKHGMTTIRNFDALNDVQNLIYSGKCIADAGLKHEVTITMMELPPGCEGAHTAEYYITILRRILDAGIPFDSIAFKDASGTSAPQKVFKTIEAARKLLGDSVRLVFHTHETAGTGTSAYRAAIRAGIDQIDLSISPVSGGTCQTDILTMWHALRGTDWDLDIDIKKIISLRQSFAHAMRDYYIPPEATMVDALIPFFPMPGGALTANTQMLRDNGLLNRYPEVIAAMGEAVKKGGFGTSVTPVSQFYFQQAFNNVMFGKWQKVAEGYGKMVLGYFGKTPVEPDPEIVEIARLQLHLEPTTESPLVINDRNKVKGIEAAKKQLVATELPVTDENIFIAASCGGKGIAFLQGLGAIGVRKKDAPAEAKKVAVAAKSNTKSTIVLNGIPYTVSIDGNSANVNGKVYMFEAKAAAEEAPAPAAQAHSKASITTPLPGLIVRIDKKVGDMVNSGDTVMIIESMKMETTLTAPVDGKISSISVMLQQQVPTGMVVAVIN